MLLVVSGLIHVFALPCEKPVWRNPGLSVVLVPVSVELVAVSGLHESVHLLAHDNKIN